MKRNLLWPASLVLVSAVLSACGGGGAGTPAPAAIPGTTLTFSLETGAQGNSAWTYGAGTLTLRTLDTTNTSVPGPVIATATVSALGTGSVTLPGSAQGVVAKTNLSPKAAMLALGDFTSVCLNTLTESAPGAQALFVTGADFASDGGGVTLKESTITTDGTNYTFKKRVPVFVTQDDSITGELKCGSTLTIPVNLPFKKGWNMIILSLDTATKTYAFGLESGTSLHYVPEDSTPLL